MTATAEGVAVTNATAAPVNRVMRMYSPTSPTAALLTTESPKTRTGFPPAVCMLFRASIGCKLGNGLGVLLRARAAAEVVGNDAGPRGAKRAEHEQHGFATLPGADGIDADVHHVAEHTEKSDGDAVGQNLRRPIFDRDLARPGAGGVGIRKLFLLDAERL